MDSQYLLITPQGSAFALLDHRPGKPDMTVWTGSQADCLGRAAQIVAMPAWEMIPVYCVQPDGTWKSVA